ncbi:MAG: peroxiredoxin, partial [Peptoniphilus sp.]
VYDKIRAGQFVRNNPGQVCPAKWKQSGETLTPGLDLVGKI